ncbi:hypothetical protein DAPPUDRAFT_112168 [Daphnia pulex]|uniref:Uncharacterized protein n=1 Tax=Daphnia pulex TaxID=6669 RepID=E9HB36_DAPPU|nr:hypothetical protein DAPPUDRAFT_112168 [Daphnia pulex]|eukprot:EFX71016.1 hypothetical protein DAPPUDRAFT_112168 [Daphnia pulex]
MWTLSTLAQRLKFSTRTSGETQTSIIIELTRCPSSTTPECEIAESTEFTARIVRERKAKAINGSGEHPLPHSSPMHSSANDNKLSRLSNNPVQTSYLRRHKDFYSEMIDFYRHSFRLQWVDV